VANSTSAKDMEQHKGVNLVCDTEQQLPKATSPITKSRG